MADLTEGLHHVTTLGAGATRTDGFMRETLGLACVKRTVNLDEPEAYHLFYGTGEGAPGTVLSSVAFPNLARGRAGVGEVGTVILAVMPGSLPHWRNVLEAAQLAVLGLSRVGPNNRLWFEGPEGEGYALQVDDTHPGVEIERGGGALIGLHGVSVRSRDPSGLASLLRALGWELVEDVDGVSRYALSRGRGNGASAIEIEAIPDGPQAEPGAGSVHHFAFAVSDRAALERVRSELAEAGYSLSEVVSGPYFESVFLRLADGLLVEFATNGPGFAADEPTASLGQELILPPEHEDRRDRIERLLEPLGR